VNELQFKLEAPYKFSNALESMKKLGAKPKVNDKYLPSFVIVDESVGNNTLGSLTAGYNKVLCDNKKLGSCVLLENNSFDLGEDSKWNGVEALSEKDIWSNHYVPSSLKSESSLNLLNSKDISGEYFVWETKSNSIRNSA